MKRNKTIKKSNFLKGAFVITLGIVITKILGILYVIPFHAIVGDLGGALYGYAYTIYLFFMAISTAGIPLAISRVVSEYQTLGYMRAKKRAFVIGKRIAFLLGLLSFFILIVFAPFIAKVVMGNLTGGNTVFDVTFVIRVISTAVLIVPILSVYRGYFEGHRYMEVPSISQVIEQFVRIFVIVLGSYLSIKVLKLSLTSAVGISVFGATIGAIFAYLYLVRKRINNKSRFNEKIRNKNEPIISNQQIFRKIIIYAMPFIMIDVFKSIYNIVDMTTVIKGLVYHASFSTMDAEVVMSMLSTWAAKFNMIILSISTGIVVSLIPNLTENYVKDDQQSIHKKINQSLSVTLFLILPMSLGISFLSKPIWMLFYGDSLYGSSILSYSIFVSLFSALFTIMISVIQVFKDYKVLFISLLSGALLKILLNTKLICAFYKLGFPAYYGVISATIIGYLVSFVICVFVLNKKYHVHYESTIKNFFDILCASILMVGILYIFKFIVPIYSTNRGVNLFIILLYFIIGVVVYLVYTYKCKTIKNIFGRKLESMLKVKKSK